MAPSIDRVEREGQRMTAPSFSLAEVNALDRDGFIAAFGGVFEHSPWIAAAGWDARPFASVEALHGALCAIMYGASQEEQLALIRAHPDLVGRAAREGGLTPASTGEQVAAGLDRLTAEEVARFEALNAAYRDRFGFPFVICARENKKASILAGFDARLGNSHEAEIATALGEIAKISRLRLRDLVREE
jgi:2-oxo-4-hydroxy-4-carboxy-5-ureidoimidazoline decarboxylase